MQALVEQMQAQLATHARDWNTHVNAELSSNERRYRVPALNRIPAGRVDLPTAGPPGG